MSHIAMKYFSCTVQISNIRWNMNDLSESDALLKELSILWIIKCDALLTKNIYNENYVKLCNENFDEMYFKNVC